MIRKLFFATLGAALLGGCVTGYQYRGGSGDYYYGQPSVDYYDDGYYGGSYGYPYGYGGYPGGYPGGWNGMLGIGLGYGGYYGPYGYPYGYGDPYYGRGHHHRPPVIVVPDPPVDPRPGHPDRPRRDDHDRDRFIMRRPLNGRAPRAVPDAAVAMPVIAAPARAPTVTGGRDLQSSPVPVPQIERIQRNPVRAAGRDLRDTFRRERDDGLKPRP
jgi:hypothetical protein